MYPSFNTWKGIIIMSMLYFQVENMSQCLFQKLIFQLAIYCCIDSTFMEFSENYFDLRTPFLLLSITKTDHLSSDHRPAFQTKYSHGLLHIHYVMYVSCQVIACQGTCLSVLVRNISILNYISIYVSDPISNVLNLNYPLSP